MTNPECDQETKLEALISVVLGARRMLLTFGFLTACHGLPALEPLTPEGASVRETDRSGVEFCQFVGTFVAGDMYPSTGDDGVRHHLRNQAGASGANIIVWDTIPPRAPTNTTSGHEYQGQIVGKAYKCP
jgi:hypothetical protein